MALASFWQVGQVPKRCLHQRMRQNLPERLLRQLGDGDRQHLAEGIKALQSGSLRQTLA